MLPFDADEPIICLVMNNQPTAQQIKDFIKASKGGEVTSEQLIKHFQVDIVTIAGSKRQKELAQAGIRMRYQKGYRFYLAS